jgi:hypothetical protein
VVRTGERAASPNPALVTGALDVLDAGVVSWGERAVLDPIAPLRSINGYGLFRVMTTTRPEITVEGTLDGRTWVEYPFRWKPVRTDVRPRFVAPHMPRLDWQMWFAALGPRGSAWWLERFAQRLLDGEPDVLELLGADPFAGKRPNAVRFVVYEYRFTTPAEREATGEWWKRDERAILGPLVRDPSARTAR